MAFPTPVDPLGRPLTHYGMMPTSDCPANIYMDTFEEGIIHEQSFADMIPERYQAKGTFWWTAQQYAMLLRPNATLKRHLESLKMHLKWEAKRPILGLHV